MDPINIFAFLGIAIFLMLGGVLAIVIVLLVKSSNSNQVRGTHQYYAQMPQEAYCVNCRARITGESNFCANCGVRRCQ